MTTPKLTRDHVLAWLGSDITYDGLVDLLTEIVNSEYTNDEFYVDVNNYKEIEEAED